MNLSINKRDFFLSTLVASLALFSTNPALAGAKDDPLLTKILINELEARDSDENNPLVLDGQTWIGKDLQKLWFKVDVERVNGETEEAELQVLYSQAIAPFWDLQIGLRKDFQPTPSRSWAVFGLQGLAPYFFDMETALFVGESGRTALRLEVGYELLFTQQLILTPDIEINFYGQNDADTGIGSGLSDIEAGLRLRYEIRREFAPYIGVNWNRRFGNSADFARSKREEIEDLQWVIGIRAWF